MANRMLFALSLILLVPACDSGDRLPRAPAGEGSTISITDVRPDLAKPLRSGETVNLRVSAAYALSLESGTVSLVVQDADNSPVAQVREVVFKGSAVLPLEATFVVPRTKSLSVFVALAGQGQNHTTTVASRTFKVEEGPARAKPPV